MLLNLIDLSNRCAWLPQIPEKIAIRYFLTTIFHFQNFLTIQIQNDLRGTTSRTFQTFKIIQFIQIATFMLPYNILYFLTSIQLLSEEIATIQTIGYKLAYDTIMYIIKKVIRTLFEVTFTLHCLVSEAFLCRHRSSHGRLLEMQLQTLIM